MGHRPVRKLLKGTDEAGQTVGYLEINRIDWDNRSAVVSRVLVGNPAERGKGYGYQMVQGLTAKAFRDLNLLTLTLEVFDFNQTALRVYERAGFVPEGTRRIESWISVVMRLNREDWEKRSG